MLGHKTMPAQDSFRGGIEVVVEELAPRLAQMGHEVTCYNRTGCDNGGLREYRGVRLKRVFTIERRGLAAVTSSFFAAVRATFSDFDIIHFHAEGPCFWMWIPKLFRKRCVATIHGLDWQREKWKGGPACGFIKAGERMAVRCASEIIVLSKGTQEYFRREYKRETVLIPNGVSRPVIRDAKEITERYGLKKDSYLLFAGRIVPEKGVHYLVEAYRGLKTEKKLVIVGGSSDTEAYARELQQEADERILFTGFLTGPILEELFGNAYLYVLPSDLEGMPLSLLEAMSYGNCCVVSDIEACTEVVGEHAVTFRKGNVEDLRETLQRLCDNEALVQKYRSGAADYICGKYSWEDTARETCALYETVKK
ncbi:MAG: glycosyltransferase family 4 protein [Lachnospiraceae bacterium]|nr:glycosyltransferase family 4 protein [Lachnospiraceae bacterium]